MELLDVAGHHACRELEEMDVSLIGCVSKTHRFSTKLGYCNTFLFISLSLASGNVQRRYQQLTSWQAVRTP
jgi:hypothetical protein